MFQILLAGKEEAVLSLAPDESLRERIEALAAKSTEGELTLEERAEYVGYVQANKFVAILRREAQTRRATAAS